MLRYAYIFFAFLYFSPRISEACSYADPKVGVLPGSTDVAPRNTKIYLFFDKRIEPTQLSLISKEGLTSFDTSSFSFGARNLLILTPKKLLARQTKYIVRFFIGEQEETRSFQTGSWRDRREPDRAIVESSDYFELPVSRCSRGSSLLSTSFKPAKREIPLQFEGEFQGENPAPAFLYAVWFADEAGKIDYQKQPLYVVDHPSTMVLNGAILPPYSLESSVLTLAVSIVDLAGNQSEPAEYTAKLNGE